MSVRHPSEADVDAMLDQVWEQLDAVRLRYPLHDYTARPYGCPGCGVVNVAIAPRADLVDGYECPICGVPEVAMAEAAP